MATNNIIHGDYVRIKYGIYANKQGYVVQIRNNGGSEWREVLVDIDNMSDVTWIYEPDVERTEIIEEQDAFTRTESIFKALDVTAARPFVVGDRVKIIRDNTGSHGYAVGDVGVITSTRGVRVIDGEVYPIVVKTDDGTTWDCQAGELVQQYEWVTEGLPSDEVPYYDRFEDIAQELIDTHNQKGADYGVTEDPYANVRSAEDYGLPAWVGVAIRMQDKMRRIQAASRQWGETGEVKLANESLEDAFLDAAVYGIIGLIMLRDEEEGTSP